MLPAAANRALTAGNGQKREVMDTAQTQVGGRKAASLQGHTGKGGGPGDAAGREYGLVTAERARIRLWVASRFCIGDG